LFGVVIVTLCPAGSTQPVAASGVLALGAAATQIVCDIRLTNVTRRWSPAGCPPAGWPAAAEEGGSAAAGTVGEWVADGRVCVAVAVAAPGCGDAGLPAVRAVAGPADPVPVVAAAVCVTTAVARSCPPGALGPRPAQPAVNVTAASVAAHAIARACQAQRLLLLPFPRLPRPACQPNLTRVLPAQVLAPVPETVRVPPDNRFLCRVFRYLRARVVSPSCDANSSRG
jgi:hypothetical protein